MINIFYKAASFGFLVSSVATATTQVVLTEGTQTSPLFSRVCSVHLKPSLECPMRVDLRNTSFEILKDQIIQASSSRGLVCLDLSGKLLHDESIEALVESLSELIQQGQLKNITEIDLSNNVLTVKGVQSLIPIIANSDFKVLNVSSNCLDGSDLFEIFGTDAAYGEYVSSVDRVLLDSQSRDMVIKKLIWLSKNFFDPCNSLVNPSGTYVTA